MRKLSDYAVVGLFMLLLISLILVAIALPNFVLIWGISYIDFLDIVITSTEAYYFYAVAMVFILAPLFPIALAIELVLVKLCNQKIYEKINRPIETVASFFLILGYIYFIDDYIDELSISLKGGLVLALIYSMFFDLLEKGVIEDKFKEIEKRWRSRRRQKRRLLREKNKSD
ncbi:hypothetical protein [Lihuaxuella thermophila]|uniref:Regulatory protein YrvL n=1 Tax=Lihuaxuella thermophila TaxID=1173111 RepID=A0A1H8BTG9_9BACL|nr:hypothetical protein [Lihuaxuella thermophila]SEM85444.1 hypothetical protein SAMN05444955_102322 [Lihuaxuella thermophila]